MDVSRIVASAFALIAVTTARQALAAPGRIHAVFWPDDTSTRAQVDAFFECLTTGSTYGTTWAQQYGLGPVTYAGSVVLPSAAPSSVTLGGNLDTIIEAAFTQGTLPPPETGVNEEYLFYFPSTSTGGDDTGAKLCTAGGNCAEHGGRQLGGYTFDYALVPIACNQCAPGLDVDTIGGEHEAAEGLADLAGAHYEVGDGCESPSLRTTLACCGQTYTIQPLAGSGGEYDCQTIVASGAPRCAAPDAGSGVAGGPPAALDSGTPTAGGPGAGADGGRAPGGGSGAGPTDGDGGASGADAGISSIGAPDADLPSTGTPDASLSAGDAPGPSSGAGCGCVAAGERSTGPGGGAWLALGAALWLARGRRRRSAAVTPPSTPPRAPACGRSPARS